MPATELSKRLTKIREERGYKRTELAEMLGIPYRTITNYETGEREPGHPYIIKIAKLFNVTTDLGSSGIQHPWGFKSPYPHQKGSMLQFFRPLKLQHDKFTTTYMIKGAFYCVFYFAYWYIWKEETTCILSTHPTEPASKSNPAFTPSRTAKPILSPTRRDLTIGCCGGVYRRLKTIPDYLKKYKNFPLHILTYTPNGGIL